MSAVLDRLLHVIADRKAHPTPGSYTAELLAAGVPQICQKVGEEAVEVVVAGLAQDEGRLVAETADLLYHCLVLLAARDIPWSAVEEELARRFR